MDSVIIKYLSNLTLTSKSFPVKCALETSNQFRNSFQTCISVRACGTWITILDNNPANCVNLHRLLLRRKKNVIPSHRGFFPKKVSNPASLI